MLHRVYIEIVGSRLVLLGRIYRRVSRTVDQHFKGFAGQALANTICIGHIKRFFTQKKQLVFWARHMSERTRKLTLFTDYHNAHQKGELSSLNRG